MSKELTVNSQQDSLLRTIAAQWGVSEIEPKKLYETLKATAFKGKKDKDGNFIPVTDEQFISLSIVAKQYKLNPFLKEIYAYPDKQGGIVPVVSVDGWANIINSHPQINGMEYRYSDNMITIGKSRSCHEWVECIITRKDRKDPTIIREYLDECYQEAPYPGPWQTHTKRLLRHKATIQCGRMAFGFGGIYDQDEAENIIKDVTPVNNITSVKDLNSKFLNIKSKEQVTIDNQKENIVEDETIPGSNQDTVQEEEIPLDNKVSTMLAEINFDNNKIDSKEWKDLWDEVFNTDNQKLQDKLKHTLLNVSRKQPKGEQK